MKPCNEFEIVGLDAIYRKYYLKGYEDAEKEHNYHLKKIRTEIEQLPSDMGEAIDLRTGQIATKYISSQKVLQIIDKYKRIRNEKHKEVSIS